MPRIANRYRKQDMNELLKKIVLEINYMKPIITWHSTRTMLGVPANVKQVINAIKDYISQS